MALFNGGFDTSELILAAEKYELEMYNILEDKSGQQRFTKMTPEIKEKLKKILMSGSSRSINFDNIKDDEWRNIINSLPLEKIVKNKFITDITKEKNDNLKIGDEAEVLSFKPLEETVKRIAEKNGWSYYIYSTKHPLINDNNYDFGVTFWDGEGREITGIFDNDLRFEIKASLKNHFHVAGFNLDNSTSLGNKILEDLKKEVDKGFVNKNKVKKEIKIEDGEINVEIIIDTNIIKQRVYDWTNTLIKSKFKGYYPIFKTPFGEEVKLSSEVLVGLGRDWNGYAQLGGYKKDDTLLFESQYHTIANTENKDDVDDAVNHVIAEIDKIAHKFDLWYGKP